MSESHRLFGMIGNALFDSYVPGVCRYGVSLVDADEIPPDQYALEFQGDLLLQFPHALLGATAVQVETSSTQLLN
jgi:hypothetical protein